MRAGAVESIEEAMSPTIQDRQGDLDLKKHRLGELRTRARTATAELRSGVEEQIACALALADETTRLWWQAWEAALVHPAERTSEKGATLAKGLESARQALEETLREAQEDARGFDQPLARLDELQQKAAEFSLWIRECLARWEMLGEAAPPLDAERIARARVGHARGEGENLDGVLSRVEAGAVGEGLDNAVEMRVPSHGRTSPTAA
jgi:hypothetical protein